MVGTPRLFQLFTYILLHFLRASSRGCPRRARFKEEYDWDENSSPLKDSDDEVWLILAIIRFEIKSLFCLTLTRRLAPSVSPGLQVIRPLQHAAVSELGLHDHVGRPAAHRELPAAENHRQRQLRQGQAGTTRPHRERGERAGSD